MVLESTGDTASHMMMKLLQSFWKTGLVTVDQMNRVSPHLLELFKANREFLTITRLYTMIFMQGFQRIYDELPEISLDVPHAHSIMETFVDLCYQEAVITKQLRDECPSRLVKIFIC